jgi:hypothetical protein
MKKSSFLLVEKSKKLRNAKNGKPHRFAISALKTSSDIAFDRGLHESDKETDEPEEQFTLTKDVSVSKENLRKLQRESERLLRERRCMIRPAPVQRRSLGDLIQKISARKADVEKSKFMVIGPVKPDQMQSGNTNDSPGCSTKPCESGECPVQPPKAPVDEVNSILNPVGLNEEDEEEEELIVISSKQSVSAVKDLPVQPPPQLPAAPETTTAAIPTLVIPAPIKSTPVLSPPGKNSIKMRKGLLDTMRKTAQLRSEHLSKLTTAPNSFVGSISVQDNLSAAAKGSFIPSDSFTGSKPGFYFQMGAQGLGYYQDLSKTSAASGKTNVLPPPLEDTAEPEGKTERSAGEEEGESQPFGLEAGEELVLDYDEEGDSMAMDAGEEIGPSLGRPKPLRTYSRKQRLNQDAEKAAVPDQTNCEGESDASDAESASPRPARTAKKAESGRAETVSMDCPEAADEDREERAQSARRPKDSDGLEDADDEGAEVGPTSTSDRLGTC